MHGIARETIALATKTLDDFPPTRVRDIVRAGVPDKVEMSSAAIKAVACSIAMTSLTKRTVKGGRRRTGYVET